jgi:DNA polymerase III subunit beta
MEIRVEPKALLAELNLALGIVESKATIPILSNILIRASESGLELAATDLEVTLRTRCPAEVLQPGAVTVQAKKIGPMIRAFQGIEGALSLKTTEGNKLFIQPVGGREEYHLNTLPEEDYPTLLDPPEEGGIRLEAGLFRRAVEEALISVGTEDNRYSVRGGLVLLDQDRVTLVSTDSHRLTKSSFPAETGLPEPVRILVPRKTLVETLKLEGEGDYLLRIKDNHIFMDRGHRILYSRLMDTTFPAYDRVIPQDATKSAVLKRTDLLEKCRRVSMVTDPKSRAITISFEPSGSCVITARSPETGDEGKEYVNCDRYEGEGVLLGFNVDYVDDFLAVSEAESILFRMKDSATQAVMEPVRKEGDGGHVYVVMPLRLD